jgi:hypothetical protein
MGEASGTLNSVFMPDMQRSYLIRLFERSMALDYGRF